jgi:hypothetical protein
VAAAPAAFRVRVWQITSWGRGPRGGQPLPEGPSVAYPRAHICSVCYRAPNTALPVSGTPVRHRASPRRVSRRAGFQGPRVQFRARSVYPTLTLDLPPFAL